MIARIQKAKESEGFTLIELLVVMIIIGILAAIAIPLFLSQREKAEDSAAKADVSTLGKEIASWYVDNTAAPSVVETATHYQLGTAGAEEDVAKRSANVALGDGLQGGGTSTTWCVDVNNPQGDKADWKYSAQGGLEQGTC